MGLSVWRRVYLVTALGAFDVIFRQDAVVGLPVLPGTNVVITRFGCCWVMGNG